MAGTGFFISHDFILIIVGLLFFSSFAIAVFYRPQEFEKTRTKHFFSILGSIAVLLVGLNLLFTSVTFEYNRRYTRTLIVNKINSELWLKPNRLFSESIHARPEFLASLNYNNPALHQAALRSKSSGPLSVKTILEEQNIAVVIFQAWEDFLTSRPFDIIGPDENRAWYGCFLVWAQSPYLREYFYVLDQSYDDSTVQFGTILFEYAAKLPIPTTDIALSRIITEMQEDPRLQVLVKELLES